MRINSRLKIYVLFILCFQLWMNSNGECATEKDYTLGIGDIITIQVWENDDLNRVVEISQEGAFTFPLIGKIDAIGLSVFEVEARLEKKLADGYLVAPQVSVGVTEYKSQKVFVFGEVKKPGTYVIKGDTPLLEVVAMADGLTGKAGPTIKIVRHIERTSQDGQVSESQEDQQERIDIVDLQKLASESGNQQIWVRWGDSIYVAKKESIFIIGEVKNPGRFEWQEGLTIHQAISIAGGPTKRASMGRTKVIRVIAGDEMALSVDMNEPANPDDIIKVPESYF